jgi:hypothetical protein
LDIVPPEVLGSSLAEYESESAVERNNLLYVAVSRAKRHLYLYQDIKFGSQTLAPQLTHYPPKYTSRVYNGAVLKAVKAAGTRTFAVPNTLNFEAFSSYVRCPLSYWYSNVCGLKSEAEIDVSLRARRAILDALKEVASGVSGSPEKSLEAAWSARALPSSTEDPWLWLDVQNALGRGVGIVRAAQKRGGSFYEPSASVGGIVIQMPWGFAINNGHGLEYAMVRFTRRGISDLSTVLKPFVPGLNVAGPKKLTLNYVLSDTVDDIPGAKKIEATKSYGAAVRFLAGDNTPTTGHHCARCDFLTICPSSPR